MPSSLSLLYLILLASLSLSCQPSPDASSIHTLTPEERARIDSLIAMDVPDDAPGMAVGIVSRGEVIYESYAGFANLADSLRLGPDFRFNIASNGKQFTALATARLIHHHKLSLDDDIRTYFPNLLPDVASPITIRHLLTHSSGIRDVYDLWSLQGKTWWQITSSNSDVIDLLNQQTALNFEPGARYMYSNSNYILLAEIIASVEETTFREATDRLFDDLNMNSTSFETDYTAIRGPLARPYFNFDTWTTYDWVTNVAGDGALFSTLPDQLRWESVIQSGHSYPLSADIVEQSQSLVPGSEIQTYGYGLEHGEYRGQPLLYHTGATGALKAVTYRFTDKQISIVLLTNSGKVLPEYTIQAITDVVLELPDSAPQYQTEPTSPGPEITDDELLGTYLTDGSTMTFQFLEKEDGIYLRRSGQNDIRLVREASNIFHQWNDRAFKLEFTTTGAGGRRVAAYYTTHAPYSLEKVTADMTAVEPYHYTGRFLNDETGAEVEISQISDDDYSLTLSGQTYSATLLTPELMLAGSYRLSFPIDPASQIQQFFLDGDRIKNVEFSRMSGPQSP